jgi:RNA polymerase sigma-70 factor, ECF subfamily
MHCQEIARGRDTMTATIGYETRRAPADRDGMLVARLRRGEPDAVEELVGTYGDRVYRLAIRITGSPPDAEEVAQDALWTACRKIDTFRGTAAFGSWLYRITANAAYQKLRRRRSVRNEIAWDDLAPSFDEKGHYLEPSLDWSPRLEDPAIESELRSAISVAIDDLPADYRAPLLLRDVDGLSLLEIAQALHIKPATIKSRVHRARLFLRKRLADLR